MSKECVCGAEIRNNRSLCRECADIYGYDESEWPEWLRWKVSDIQREHDFYRLHNELRLESIEPNGRGGYRAKREFALRGCRTETHLYKTEPTTRGSSSGPGLREYCTSSPATARS